MRASALCLLLIAPCAGVSGCASVPASDDASRTSDADRWPGARGTVQIVMTDEGVAPADALDLTIASILLASDRDPEQQPTRNDVGTVRVGADGLDLAFDRVAPGLYSAVDIELGPQHVLELALHGLAQSIVIRAAAPLSLRARCEQGQAITVSGTLRIVVDLALQDAVAAALRHPLPPATGGVIVLDEASAPEAVADFRAALAAGIHAECEQDAR